MNEELLNRVRPGHERRIVGVTLTVGDVSAASLFVYCTGCAWYTEAKDYGDIAVEWIEHTGDIDDRSFGA